MGRTLDPRDPDDMARIVYCMRQVKPEWVDERRMLVYVKGPRPDDVLMWWEF